MRSDNLAPADLTAIPTGSFHAVHPEPWSDDCLVCAESVTVDDEPWHPIRQVPDRLLSGRIAAACLLACLLLTLGFLAGVAAARATETPRSALSAPGVSALHADVATGYAASGQTGAPAHPLPAVVASPTPRPTIDATPRVVSVPAPITGIASWYPASPGDAAAGPALRHALGRNWRGTVVTVTADGHSVRVKLTDWCGCRVDGSERVIDLSRSDFARLAAPSRGLVRVTIERLP